MPNHGEIFILLIIAIAIGGGIIKKYMTLMVMRMDQRMSRQDQDMALQVSAMRQELAQLRDTSTQYAMSLQSRLEELEHRVGHFESSGRPAAAPLSPTPTPQPTDTPQQTIGANQA